MSHNSNINPSDYSKPIVCALCGGVCCARHAGIYHPKDFKEEITVDFIYGLLKTGKFKVNQWDGEFEYMMEDFEPAEKKKIIHHAYFLMPRHFGQKPFEQDYGGTCVNWKLGSGCSLSFQDRPYQCKTLIAHINGEGKDAKKECKHLPKDKAEKEDLIIAWLPFGDILRAAGEKLEADGLNTVDPAEVAHYDKFENSGVSQIYKWRERNNTKTNNLGLVKD